MGNDDDLGYDQPDQQGGYDKCPSCKKYVPTAELDRHDGWCCDTCWDIQGDQNQPSEEPTVYYCFDSFGNLVDAFDFVDDAVSYCRDHPGTHWGHISPVRPESLRQVATHVEQEGHRRGRFAPATVPLLGDKMPPW